MKCLIKYKGEEFMTLLTDHNVYQTLEEFGYSIWWNGIPFEETEYDLDGNYIEIIPL